MDILKDFYGDDIIYHYTKASTAIDYILFTKELKFSHSKNAYDPIEKCKSNRGLVAYGDECCYTKAAEELDKELECLENSFYQLCFCKNKNGCDSILYALGDKFVGKEECYGFTKLRMWDQYADKYLGVCIAFSKKKLLEINKDLNIISQDVEYFTFQELWEKKQGDINSKLSKDSKNYREDVRTKVMKSFCYKHIDYAGETEFRIGTFFTKQNGEIEPQKLKIEDALKAIFVSSYANAKQKDELYNYAQELNIPLIEIKWKYDSIELSNYKDTLEMIKIIMQQSNNI